MFRLVFSRLPAKISIGSSPSLRFCVCFCDRIYRPFAMTHFPLCSPEVMVSEDGKALEKL